MNRIFLLTFVCCCMTTPFQSLSQTNAAAPVRLITLDPGHFHAALVQKFMYADVDPTAHVYAPDGDDLAEHLKRIERFNTRTDDPTRWQMKVHAGPDFLQQMLAEKPGNVVVISGNNARKTDYILASVSAGLNVLADKPMAITPEDLEKLKRAFEVAASKNVLLYDIMTERFEITTILQRELSRMPELFGELLPGSVEQPSITKESVHHFSKTVSGVPLKRPQWFFDSRQQGEGIVDVTTHLVDLIQWEAFPGHNLSVNDVEMLQARRWPTPVTPDQFRKVTGADNYPDYLKKDVEDGVLQVYANGEFIYTLRGIHAKVSVKWDFEARPGAGDTHFSIMRGTKANLVIRQGAEQKFKPVLYIEQANSATDAKFADHVKRALETVAEKYPGVGVERDETSWRVTVPEKYHNG
ncbi:MAG TPA: putative oxidoreductase C-terminal domain-containing protein, partial [Verrucomicrobiota bacterium]|nr:putative oxidoreductase C-terminal domain-containing protein [Verrucomicrobiota bacterium]